MYYRPREKKRHPLVSFLLSTLLIIMIGVLALLLAIYVGYIDYQPPTLAERLAPTPTPTRPAVLYVADGDQYFAEGKLDQAIDAYEEALQREPDNDVAYIRQSRLLVYTRNTARAVDRAAHAVLLQPESPENLAYYCRALDWEARYDEAFDAQRSMPIKAIGFRRAQRPNKPSKRISKVWMPIIIWGMRSKFRDVTVRR
jgi:tetratricopeptide (TPR) repeat protein